MAGRRRWNSLVYDPAKEEIEIQEALNSFQH